MKKRKWWIPVVLGILVVVGLLVVRSVRSSGVVLISGTAQVNRGGIEAIVTANGTLTAKEEWDVLVEVPVKVTAVLIEKDQPVRKDQAVLEVDLSDLENQLQQARLNRDSQELSLRRIRDLDMSGNLETLRLAVRQAENILASDRTSLQQAETELVANRKLHEAGVISDSELDRYERMVRDAKQRVTLSGISLSTAQANLANSQRTEKRTNEQRDLDIATQENMLALQELNVTTMEERLARVEAALLSPMDGVLTLMNGKVGQMLSSAQPAYRVTNLQTLEVQADVKEVESRRIREGQRVIITGDGIDPGLPVEGMIGSVAPTATITRTTSGEETVVRVGITIEQPPEGLRPGLTVTARIVTDTREDVPVIRYAMMAQTPDGTPAVYLLRDGVAVLTPIEIGVTANLDIEVTSGLQGGETVILNPPQELEDGMRVRTEMEGMRQ